jgi:hypothetical protein
MQNGTLWCSAQLNVLLSHTTPTREAQLDLIAFVLQRRFTAQTELLVGTGLPMEGLDMKALQPISLYLDKRIGTTSTQLHIRGFIIALMP